MRRMNPFGKFRLTRRDRDILDHVGRFRMTTNEVLHRVFFAGQQPNAVTKVTARLCANKYLKKFPLIYPQGYFRLGERGAATLGLHESRTLPLGVQSLPTEYGVLCYATLRSEPLKRMTAEEVQQRFPFLDRAWCDVPYLLREEQPQSVVELVRVDLGGTADHVARKVFDDVMTRIQAAEFRQLVRARLFRCVVITTTTEKAAAIQASLNPFRWPEGLAMHLAAVPDLLPLIPGGDRVA